MNLYWALFKIVVLTFAPLVPVSPKLTRPDPVKNVWIFECESFTSCFDIAKTFHRETATAKKLA